MGKNNDISDAIKDQIKLLIELEFNNTQIGKKIGVSRSVVSRVKSKLLKNKSIYNQRIGNIKGKKATNERDDRLLIREAKKNRRATSRQLQQVLQSHGVTVNARTIRRRLFNAGLPARRPRKKQKITPKMAQKRLQWALTYKDWTAEDWERVRIFFIFFLLLFKCFSYFSYIFVFSLLLSGLLQ